MSTEHPLRAHVREHAANRPGVYRMLDAQGNVLYVGKSIRVRGRILSYFRADRSDKASELIQEARRIAWEYVPNEFASLVREMKLIQRWQPKYNVQHRRQRRCAFVKVTREVAPRVIHVTRVVDDGSTYYGPFPAARHMARTIRELAQTLELRDCPATMPIHYADQLDLWAPDRTPGCLRADLRTCLAPCCGRTTAAAYLDRLQAAHRYLEGAGAEPVRLVDDAMRRAAARMDFEYAAILRDRGDRLRRFQEELIAFRGQVESLSFIYRIPGHDGDDRLYLIRRGTIRAELPVPARVEDRSAVAERIRDVYGQGEPGPAGLRASEAAEILLVARWFRARPHERARTQSPGRWLSAHGIRRRRVRTHAAVAVRRSSPGTLSPSVPGAQPPGTRIDVLSVTASTAGREYGKGKKSSNAQSGNRSL